MRAMRLRKEDLEFMDDSDPADEYAIKCISATGLALYSACEECIEAHRLRVGERMELKINQVTNGMLC